MSGLGQMPCGPWPELGDAPDERRAGATPVDERLVQAPDGDVGVLATLLGDERGVIGARSRVEHRLDPEAACVDNGHLAVERVPEPQLAPVRRERLVRGTRCHAADAADDATVAHADDRDLGRADVVDVCEPPVGAEDDLRRAVCRGDPMQLATRLDADHGDMLLPAHRDPDRPPVGRHRPVVRFPADVRRLARGVGRGANQLRGVGRGADHVEHASVAREPEPVDVALRTLERSEDVVQAALPEPDRAEHLQVLRVDDRHRVRRLVRRVYAVLRRDRLRPRQRRGLDDLAGGRRGNAQEKAGNGQEPQTGHFPIVTRLSAQSERESRSGGRRS